MVELHADDARISEDEAERHLEEPAHEKALKICRTVTQVGVGDGATDWFLLEGSGGAFSVKGSSTPASHEAARSAADLFDSDVSNLP